MRSTLHVRNLVNNHEYAIGKILFVAVNAPKAVGYGLQRVGSHELCKIVQIEVVISAAIIIIERGGYRDRQFVLRSTVRMIEEFVSMIIARSKTKVRQKKSCQKEGNEELFRCMPGCNS
ncbi:MAG: hypothetical protein JSV29_04450 [Candidatus Bathyarchaeota archaeon]|nr:MAG: hypothetical protein JSV29_04450 [Candidatus Bathyarchaeota archaeon]